MNKSSIRYSNVITWLFLAMGLLGFMSGDFLFSTILFGIASLGLVGK